MEHVPGWSVLTTYHIIVELDLANHIATKLSNATHNLTMPT